MSRDLFNEAALAQSIAGANDFEHLFRLLSEAIDQRESISNFDLLISTAIYRLKALISPIPNALNAKIIICMGEEPFASVNFSLDGQNETNAWQLAAISINGGNTISENSEQAMLLTILNVIARKLAGSGAGLFFQVDYDIAQEV